MNGVQPPTRWKVLGRFGLVEAAVGATLVLLLYHAAEYVFLTDDAFISFRYARNLSSGHGLVFNPGFERVEGYTNFLWVLLLAGFNVLGLAPESVSHALTIGATIALWGLVVWFVYRTPPRAGCRWLLVAAPLFLAATRSVAVWSTSGLETRLFEVLVVAGAFRLIVEVESVSAGRRRRPVSPLLFALATLTRPDGLLISAAAFAAAGWHLANRRRLNRRAFAVKVGLYALIVGAHYAFRLIYYGQWFPNTYYAKVDGRTWWNMGGVYLGMFALEYAVYLWVPLLIAALYEHRSRKTLFAPLLFAAIVVPHALYTASIGGDHFEYRPLDVYFPFLFVLMYAGARRLASGPVPSVLTGAYLGVVLVGLTALPFQSHRQYPDKYVAGFPGLAQGSAVEAEFMRSDRDPIYRLPGLRRVAQAYRSLLRTASAEFVGLRQEEHRLFFDAVVPAAHRLRHLVETGILPADAHIAVDCVGVIPYFSDLRVLDRLGLTDAHVAHSEFRGWPRLMAHDKIATLDYARRAGVDLWATDNVYPLVHATYANLLHYVVGDRRQLPVYAAYAGDDSYLLGLLPQGVEHARRRFPELRFRPLAEREVAVSIMDRAIECHRRRLKENPNDQPARTALADKLMYVGDAATAVKHYRALVSDRRGDTRLWHNLAIAHHKLGELDEAIAAAEHALKLARERPNQKTANVHWRLLMQYRSQRQAPGDRPTTRPRDGL